MTPRKFLDINPPYTDYKNARFVIIPVPFEKTVSYGGGTAKGPEAILKASQFIEDYDIELDIETYRAGMHVSRPVKDPKKLTSVVEGILKDAKVPVVLGGEHSVTPFAVAACMKHHKDLSVLQFDAHADLRDSYHGSKNSHACAARRILEICPVVQVGIRSMDISEAKYARSSGQISKIHFADKLELTDKISTQLSKNVYITFDVDVLDPSIMPSTGTPEPGGMYYYDILDIFRDVSRQNNIIGFDFVELSPVKGISHPDFTTAKLIYKMMGYITSKQAK